MKQKFVVTTAITIDAVKEYKKKDIKEFFKNQLTIDIPKTKVTIRTVDFD
jgi:hypothetical protein